MCVKQYKNPKSTQLVELYHIYTKKKCYWRSVEVPALRTAAGDVPDPARSRLYA